MNHHTRYDLMELGLAGSEFLTLARASKPFNETKDKVVAWLAQLDRVLVDDLDAAQRMELEDGLGPIRDFFTNKRHMAQTSLITGFYKTAASLQAFDAMRRSGQ